jgi:hypothetical protein
MERCRAGLKTWLSVLACEDALPRAAFLQRKSTGVECEHGNLGPLEAGVNVKILRPMILRLRDGQPARSAGVPSTALVSLWIQGPAARFTRIEEWSGRRDSNPRHPAWKARALPTELLPLKSIYGKALYTVPSSGRCRTRSRRRFGWWRGEDSNLRRHRRQIYSLFPLTAREPLHTIGSRGPVMVPRPGARVRPAVPPGPDRPGRSSGGLGASVGHAARIVELAKGLEPPTTSLQMRCSTS